LIYYLEAFDGIFGVFLKNEDPQNPEEVQVVAIKLEINYLAACELPPIHVPDQPVKVTPLDDLQPLVVKEVQEVCVIEDETQLAPYQVPRDEQEGDSPILDDLEPIVAPVESHAEFQEDEGEDLNTQECSLVISHPTKLSIIGPRLDDPCHCLTFTMTSCARTLGPIVIIGGVPSHLTGVYIIDI
jgi:hypothetical protein